MTTIFEYLDAPDIGVSTRDSVDIVSYGAFTPAGRGLDAIARALVDGDRPIAVDKSVHDPEWPAIPVLPVADFVPETILGRKGLSRLSRSDRLAIATCAMAYGDTAATIEPGETGVVLGTAVGSTGTLGTFLRDTFEQRRPYLVDAGLFPSTMMNSAAGNTAIRLGLTGVNATVSGGSLAALQAIHYARTVMAAGHARQILAGGVEELSAPYAWAWQHAGMLTPGTALSEGCAVFGLLRPDDSRRTDSPVLGRILASDIRCADPGRGAFAVASRLAESIREVLNRAEVSPDSVTTLVPGAQSRRGFSALERRAVRDGLGGGSRRILHTHQTFGEAHGVGVALRLAALLATWQHPTHPATDLFALVTGIGIDGAVGCLLVAHPDLT
ncbi:beta-ketoacyl synthase N-terminal-like domain-containing protein [Nocardia terpenica]|uniref:Beta-ketoacyl synthase-like N-terminal domain-containing protein n=1 Tax=Nocardia terpenica TaxID=455432 RepID=A0A164I3G5_9NOCA|nr:beta-ketoacyl synthase N-terminal-like domain-containing protein [Nocardia terpenica]KZM69066.1 hypothetical protein AWN90_15120 [Nocardia terpenica]NQE87832.1 hypothetical protein [Nocardia terpenica]